ncbi:MAG: protein phosphatase 2C domain-containing protein, partial [Psychrobacter sp.]|nr:protein phosphatase 2C domain-containing protein [Psychrobacter sp.]
MTDADCNTPLGPSSPSVSLDHHSATDALWWFDFCTMAGRKRENQDSILITTCLPYLASGFQVRGFQESTTQTDISLSKARAITTVESGKPKAPNAKQRPLLVILADGVSACQFPKQASRQAVTIIARKVTHGLMVLAQQQSQSNLLAQSELPSDVTLEALSNDFDDDQVASLIKAAVNKANDALYFSQAYQRVPPLLSTVSGVLCIGDRIHLFHTGDSRIYRVGADSLTVLSHDHRVHHGQDKGALSAALGADTVVDLQQSVFTLHQNESLALMTDGVFEHIDATELQFELCSASTKLFEQQQSQYQHQSQHDSIKISKPLCQYAFNEGSNDNLTMVAMGMTALGPLTGSALPSMPNQKANSKTDTNDKTNEVELDETEGDSEVDQITRYKLPIGLQVGEKIDGFVVTEIIARTARSEVYLVEDLEGREFVLKSPSVNTVGDGDYLREFLKERKIG